jgi:hypothetical protein
MTRATGAPMSLMSPIKARLLRPSQPAIYPSPVTLSHRPPQPTLVFDFAFQLRYKREPLTANRKP